MADNDDRAPRGTWNGAHLVTSYMALESRAPIYFAKQRSTRVRVKTARMRRLVARLRAVREALGLIEQPAYFERRPVAVPVGPFPLPERRPRRPQPATVTVRVGPDWTVPSESLTRPGFGWYFRSGLAQREPMAPSHWPFVLA